MSVTFRFASEVRDVAAPMLNKHHSRLSNTRLEFVFVSSSSSSSKARLKQGEPVAGSAKIVSGLSAFLVEGEAAESEPVSPFFVIEIAEDIWDAMTVGQRKALVDHQLEHCNFDTNDNDGSQRLFIAQHDVEDFTAIVRRHGLWQRGLKKFAQAVVQLELPMEELQAGDGDDDEAEAEAEAPDLKAVE